MTCCVIYAVKTALHKVISDEHDIVNRFQLLKLVTWCMSQTFILYFTRINFLLTNCIVDWFSWPGRRGVRSSVGSNSPLQISCALVLSCRTVWWILNESEPEGQKFMSLSPYGGGSHRRLEKKNCIMRSYEILLG
jgi:hypothetical protein